MSNIRVAVIQLRTDTSTSGAGIGGLTFCVALGKQSNIKMDLYEAAHEFGEIGAGIGMWYRTQQIMEKLGLYEDLAALEGGYKQGNAVAFHFRKSDQPKGLSFYDMNTTGGMLPLHRASFQKTIINHLPPTCTSHFGKRLVSYDDPASGPITMRFNDGTTAECDVLIGADGIKSAVRATLISNLAKEGKVTKEEATQPNPVWSGTVAYRGLIPKERLEAKAPGHRALTEDMLYCGKNKHLIIFPINKGALINVVAFCSDPSKEGTQYSENSKEWVVDVPKEELLQQYEGWEPEVTAVLECVDKPSRWAINVARQMSTYASGRVAILGDSAHAMTPNLGSGAGQAIEDAYVLAALLANPKCTPSSLPRVLQIYDEVRRPKASNVWHLSRTNGLIYEFNGAGCEHVGMYDDNVSSEMLAKIGKEAEEHWEWAWKTSAEEDREQAVSMLSEL
ncbi:FAD/NAD(P)-binding domain-containing protein [Athelia psychrophila]|uniref:FAD/NAD(P)-binding domain-containing protein n=1 Tax=Athelia psychrophila TaxID=1759441 RepID=A0A165WVW5_9AGAM|nr:FAD/NAD(P)-binding domain-containing protein [Fibularhizoctonia sp. CBS 109695]